MQGIHAAHFAIPLHADSHTITFFVNAGLVKVIKLSETLDAMIEAGCVAPVEEATTYDGQTLVRP